MAAEKLKTGVLGLNDQGREALSIIAESPNFQICAVADSDAELAEKVARTHGCNHFYDYRQLVIQSELDVLIACEPACVCAEFVRLAMSKGCNVIKFAPAALDFDQSAQLTEMAAKNKVRFFVASSELFSDGFIQLTKFIESEGPEAFHLITAVYNLEGTVNEPQNRWLTDPSLAGGGVLLHNCYPIVRQILAGFGTPERVYALTSNVAPDKQQRLAITEDSIVMTMQYHDILMAQITASRTFGPYEHYIRLHTNDKFVTVNTNSFNVSANDGHVITSRSYNTTELDWKTEMLDTFARDIIEPNRKTPPHNIDLHTMATIQAAYLSAKTAVPEEPSRLLDLMRT